MYRFASAEHNSKKDSDSNTLMARLLAGPLRLGIWAEDEILWIYPSSRDLAEHYECGLTVTSMNSTKDYEMIKFNATNHTGRRWKAKVVVQYRNIFKKHSTSFYSPNENAIVSFSDDSVSVLGGLLGNKGMVQYSIQENHSYSTRNLVEDMKKGSLPMKWLGQGNITSIFTLETVLEPKESCEGTIWTFHSVSEEAVQALKREKVDTFLQ